MSAPPACASCPILDPVLPMPKRDIAIKITAYIQEGIGTGIGNTITLPPGNKKIEAKITPQTAPDAPTAE